MRGGYALKTSVPGMAAMLDATAGDPEALESRPRYDIAPTQPAPVCRSGENGERRIDLLRWGLIPYWGLIP